jgi:hypothetical protein
MIYKSNKNVELEGYGGKTYYSYLKVGRSISALSRNTLIKVENVS